MRGAEPAAYGVGTLSRKYLCVAIGLLAKNERLNRLDAQKLRVEAYFARQMGMTVPEWREAQAGRKPSAGRFPLFWKAWAALSVPAMVLYWRSFG